MSSFNNLEHLSHICKMMYPRCGKRETREKLTRLMNKLDKMIEERNGENP